MMAGVAALAGMSSLALAAGEGDPDPGFNAGQPVVVAAGPSGSATKLVAVAKQADGKVVVVGNTDSGNGSGSGTWVIERYLTSGQLDSGFGSAGIVKLGLGGVTSATGLVVQPSDQRILVGGQRYSGGAFGAEFVRLNADGSLDTSFGGSGEVFLSRSGVSVLGTGGLALDASGNAYLAGGGMQGSSSVGVIAGVTPTGAPDGWASGGILVPDTSSAGPSAQLSGVAVSGGTVFFAGAASDSSQNSYGLMGAVNASNGSAVSAFGSGGVFRLAQNTALNGVLVAADGKLKATGFGVGSGPGTGALIASFNASGANPTDPSFGSGGQVIVGGAANQPNNGNAITEANGKLFVAATAALADGSTQVSLVGVDEKTGALDTGLGSGGYRVYGFGAQSYATAAADPNGDLFLAGVVQQTKNGVDQGLLAAVQLVSTPACKSKPSLPAPCADVLIQGVDAGLYFVRNPAADNDVDFLLFLTGQSSVAPDSYAGLPTFKSYPIWFQGERIQVRVHVYNAGPDSAGFSVKIDSSAPLAQPFQYAGSLVLKEIGTRHVQNLIPTTPLPTSLPAGGSADLVFEGQLGGTTGPATLTITETQSAAVDTDTTNDVGSMTIQVNKATGYRRVRYYGGGLQGVSQPNLKFARDAGAAADPIQIAVMRLDSKTRSCRWVSGHAGTLARAKKAKGCPSPLWLTASSTKTGWRYALRPPPPGSYFVFVRHRSELYREFSPALHNLFKVHLP